MTKAVIADGSDNKILASQCPASKAVTANNPNLRKEIKPLTTLRFFAAFAVVLNHASDSFSCWHGLNNCFIVGQAVTFFFVLSGFILTYNYFHLSGSRSAFSFYIARLARIWPAHLTSILLLLLLIPEVFKVKSGDLPLFLTNLSLLQSWIPSWHVFFSYNASAWSISTELFFYLCFPFLLWGMKNKWYLPMAISSAVLGLLICFSNSVHLPEFDPLHLSNQGLLYISPLSSLFDFCAGMTAALIWRNHLSCINLNKIVATFLELTVLAGVCTINVCSSAMRYASVSWAGDAGAYWIQNSGPAVLGFALLIMIFAMDRGWVSKLFNNSALVLLGELSFGIYMLHGVLITFIGINFPQEQSVKDCLAFIITLFVSAHLMFEIVEKPMRKLMIKNGKGIIDLLESKIRSTYARKNNTKQMTLSSECNFELNGSVQSMLPAQSNFELNNLSQSALSATKTNSWTKLRAWLAFNRQTAIKEHSNEENRVISNARKNHLRHRTLLTLEALVFATFIYFSLPTINQMTKAEADASINNSMVINIALPPYLICRSASTTVSDNKVSLSLGWEALQAENVNFTVMATAMDRIGKPLGSITYTQDGRQQKVKRGTCWVDNEAISFDVNAVPNSVAVTVLRNKHEVLHSKGTRLSNSSFNITLNNCQLTKSCEFRTVSQERLKCAPHP